MSFHVTSSINKKSPRIVLEAKFDHYHPLDEESKSLRAISAEIQVPQSPLETNRPRAKGMEQRTRICRLSAASNNRPSQHCSPHTLAGAQPSFESEQAKQPRKRGIDSIKKGEMSPAHRGAALSQSISMQGKSTQEKSSVRRARLLPVGILSDAAAPSLSRLKAAADIKAIFCNDICWDN
jgi:hypothetical protein